MARVGRRKRSANPAPPPPPPPGATAVQPPATPPGASGGAPPVTATARPVTGAGRPRPTNPPGTMPAAGTGPGTMPPRPTVEGLRAWLATLDRKVGLRTYLGLAAVILALAASAVAVVLAIDARDNSADNDDLNAISERVNELESGSTAEFDAAAFEARLTAIEDQLADGGAAAGGGDTGKRLDVLENDIEELRDQIAELESGGNP